MTEELLQPRSLDEPPGNPSPDTGRKKWPAGCALLMFFLMVGGGLWALWQFSGKVDPAPGPKPVSTPTPLPEPASTPDPALRKQAEDLQAEVLGALGPIRAAEPSHWAEDVWQRVESHLDVANEAMESEDYRKAVLQYEKILPDLKQLQQALPGLPDMLYPRAYAAYGKGDADTATALLKSVLYVDSEHAQAKQLLPLAEKADVLFAGLQKAKVFADNDEWELAWVELNRLAEQDPDFPGSRELRERVTEEMTREEFQKMISQAAEAFEEDDLTSAEAFLSRAAALRPDHPAVLDLQKQVRESVRQNQVQDLAAKAETLEKEENWTGAHRTWLKLKALDANAPWIEQGLRESLHWKQIEEKISRAMDAPASTQAGKWLAEFADRAEWPPGLKAKALELEKLRELALAPVKVTLLSDHETSVQVQGVGRWEPFVKKDIELKPGTYVAKGHRLGYRDVRIPFDVKPGEENVKVTVICTEGI